MQEYQQIHQHLLRQEIVVNGKKLSATDYFDYEKDKLKDVFARYFDFCITALKRTEDKYNTKPSFAIYLKDFSVNARAGLIKENFLILFNMGLIANLYPFFIEHRFDFMRSVYNRFEVI